MQSNVEKRWWVSEEDGLANHRSQWSYHSQDWRHAQVLVDICMLISFCKVDVPLADYFIQSISKCIQALQLSTCIPWESNLSKRKLKILLRLVMLEESSKVRLSPKSIQPSGTFSLTINSYYTQPSGACLNNITPNVVFAECLRVRMGIRIACWRDSWVLICAGARVVRAALANCCSFYGADVPPVWTPRHQDCASGPSQQYDKCSVKLHLSTILSLIYQTRNEMIIVFFGYFFAFENMTHRTLI